MDIEAGTTNPKLQKVFPDPRVARHNIVSIVAWDNYNKKYYIFMYREDLEQKQYNGTVETLDGDIPAVFYQTDIEANLIVAFARFWGVKQFDKVKGWNSDDFDIPYYFTRARNLNVLDKVARWISPTGNIRIDYKYTDIPGMKSFDLMKGARKILGKYVEASLQSVSMLKLGVGKLGETVSALSAWRYDIQRLIDYNVRDVELTVKLDETIPIFSFFRNQVEMTGAEYSDALIANFRVCEQFIKYHKDKHPFLDDFMIENVKFDEQKDFDGAIVLDAIAGIADIIAVHDLSMMYPNIMLSCNMSPETIVWPNNHTDEEWAKMDPIEVDGVYFRTDFIGFIPRLIKMQIDLRYQIEAEIEQFAQDYGEGFEKTEEFETLMQQRINVKGLINSWYGIFGFKNFILYDYLIAKSVTYLGVKQIEWSRDFVKEKYNLGTHYGDTDSVFLDTLDEVADLDKITGVLEDVYELEQQLRGTKNKEDKSQIKQQIEVIKRSIDLELEKVAEFHSEVGDAITESYDDFATQYNIKEHSFSMKFEKLYARIFFSKPKDADKYDDNAAKKRYAGLLVYKDGKPVWKIDITGFQAKRSDTAKITIDCQEEVLEAMIFTQNTYPTVYKIMRKYYLAVNEGRLHPDRVGVPQGFGRSLRSYKKKSRTYRWYAAQWSNDHLGTNYGKGDKPRGVALRYFPPPWNQYPIHKKHKYNWLAFSDEHPIRPEFIPYVDWSHMADKTIIQPMQSIYQSVGIKTSSIISGTKKSNVRKGF